jgi:hypothetical protein
MIGGFNNLNIIMTKTLNVFFLMLVVGIFTFATVDTVSAATYTQAQYDFQILRVDRTAAYYDTAGPFINFSGWPAAICRQKAAAARAATTQAQKDAAYAGLLTIPAVPGVPQQP